MKRNGQVLAIADKDQSRRELTVTTANYERTRITLAGGVLGTPDGLEVVDRASDLEAVALSDRRRRNRPRKGE